MARCLIVGCGCRGQALARALRADGTRRARHDPRSRADAAIEAAGAEPYVGDPDRVGTLFPALAHVGVACVLLGSAVGTREQLAALHSTRLDMLLEKMLDTTVRAVVYEAAGTVDPELLATGAGRVRHWCERSLIPYVLLEADAADHEAWTAAAAGAVRRALMAEGRTA